MPPADADYRYDLGAFGRAVTTSNATAQLWFDRGLTWSYAFHHEEAIRCFERALRSDASCAMAYWGLAFALGPNYNKPWDSFDEADLHATLARINDANVKAKQHASGAAPVEQALIEAIQSRVPMGTGETSFTAANVAYAEAMADVYAAHAEDVDVAALYADALMNITAWNLWDLRTGEPTPGARSMDAKAVLEKAMAGDHHDAADHGHQHHPGILHLYIHLMEMSSTPEVALVPADHLRNLVPSAGHLVHMPSHLDVLVGDYRRAIDSNTDACAADELYVSEHGGAGFYSFYRLHDYHSLIYAAMFAGQYGVAMDAVSRMEKSLPESLLRVESPPMADWLENFVATRVHVLVRFGRWEDILALEIPKDQGLYCVTTAMIHYGKGVAFAAKGDLQSATRERELFVEAVDKVPSSRIAGDFPNKSSVVLQVGVAMLDGELEYRRGNLDVAFDHLRTAVERDDALNYAEPWPWMMPTRHAYAALLLEQDRVEAAAQAYAADLGLDETLPRARQHPNNVWALHGYHECLVRLGKIGEAKMVEVQLRLARAVADVDVRSSCYCAGGKGRAGEQCC